MMGGTLSPTSLIFSAALAVERLGRTRRKRGESRHGCSSFARREETIRDAEDNVPPVNGYWRALVADDGRAFEHQMRCRNLRRVDLGG